MTLILVFLLGVIALALWWLVRQGILTKPWLETGPQPAFGPAQDQSAPRLGLIVFLVVVGALFALFGSAFVMRMDLETFASLTLPPIIWANTAQLVLASLFLHAAAASAERNDVTGFRREVIVAALATAGFLGGQALAWRELSLAGTGLATGPAASFFYLLSGLHGLHIIGGLGALGLAALHRGEPARAGAGLRLCATYWDFLLIVWLGLLVLFLGWANRLVDFCGDLLT